MTDVVRRFDEKELRKTFQAYNAFKQDTIPAYAACDAAACFKPHIDAAVITPSFFGAPALAPHKGRGPAPRNMHGVSEDAFVEAMQGPGGLLEACTEDEHASYFFRLLEQQAVKSKDHVGSVGVPATLLPAEAKDHPPLAALAYVATGCQFSAAVDRADSVLRTCKVPRMNAAETKKCCGFAATAAPGAEKQKAKEEAEKKKKDAEKAQDLKSKAFVAAKAPIAAKVEKGKTYYWCTCGKSQNQPFCDGAHVEYSKEVGVEFTPLAWTAEEDGEKHFCACKKTSNAPFCDGTHSSLE